MVSTRNPIPDDELSRDTSADGGVFEKLILEESAKLRITILVYQAVGRVLFTGIMLAAYLMRPAYKHLAPILIFVGMLALVWMLGALVTSRRMRLISKMVAETEYSDNSRWGTLFIRLHSFRYDETLGQVTSVILFGEPVLWGLLSFWILL